MIINVLHIVGASYPSYSGYTIRTENILNSINDKNIHITVACSIFGRRKDQLRFGKYFLNNNRVYYQLLSPLLLKMMNIIAKIPKVRAFFKYCYIILNAFLIHSRVNIYDYDIIHGHSTFTNGISALLQARLYKKPFVYDVHALGIDAYNRNTIRYKFEKLLENFVINNSDAIIVIDSNLKEHIKTEFNILHDKIHVAPNGIASGLFTKRKKDIKIYNKYNIPHDKYLVGIDNSKPIEGFNFIINNYNKIIIKIKNVHFIVFGSKKKNNFINGFTFLPQIKYSDMPFLYSIVDLFIIPRPKSTQTDTVTPLKLLELMSCEIPLIVSNVAGLTSCIKDNKTGFIFKENDVSDLIKKISYVTNNNISEVTTNAREWVGKNKSWELAWQQYSKCYNQLM